MASAGQTERVREVAQAVVLDAGLYLEDVTIAAAGPRSVVRIVVDLDEDAVGGLDLDSLAEVSRQVSEALDATDVVPGVYTLEVSTPGTSRPLTQARHFKRARGRLVTLQLHDGATILGRLLKADDEQLVLQEKKAGGHAGSEAGPERSVRLTEVSQGTVEVELSRAAQAVLDESDDSADSADSPDADEQEER